MAPRSAALASLALGACPAQDEPGWETVAEELDGGLLSVWGSAADDVWIVGVGGALLHYDGERVAKVEAGTDADLWWISGLGDTLWLSGSGGTVVKRDRLGSEATSSVAPTPDTLFGIFPLADDDVWACGGDPEAQTAVIWHFDGAAWTAPPDLDPALLDGQTCFKIWGTSSDDLWFVGHGGRALHREAAGWTEVEVPLGRPLFTVHGEGDDIVAVGGSNSAHVLAVENGALVDHSPAGAPQLNGVHVGGGRATAVGMSCGVWMRDEAGEWTEDSEAPIRQEDLHAVWVAPEGDIWAAGGRLFDNPPSGGLLAHYGDSVGRADIQ